MITARAFRGKRYGVLGLARSGLATVEALVASGAEVVAWDANEAAREALKKPLPFRSWPVSSPGRDREANWVGVGPLNTLNAGDLHTRPTPSPSPEGEGSLSIADPLTIDLAGFDGVVVSPGVPINRHPIADHARTAGVPLIGDIELFAMARAELPPHKVVGITGTNGKSTTTALIHHILQVAGVPSLMGGNIGLPILGRDPLPAGGVYVLELSSYQIDLTYTLDCDVAVLLNITPDHLDRYDGFEGYAAAKARLFAMQSALSLAVVADGMSTIEKVAPETFNLHYSAGAGVMFAEAEWVERQSEYSALQGPHNAQNIAAAMTVAFSLQIDRELIEVALTTYPGLPHRMERIRELNGVLYVNDSKATNPTSTAPALSAYPAIHWILGGRAKSDELDACAPHFGHVRAAYTIGEAGPMFAKLLRPHIPVAECGVLDEAVNRAAIAAKSGETVLLSPACASFDQFTDYEARGAAFRAAVEAL